MTDFLERLKAKVHSAEETSEEKEHPIVETLQEIGDERRVNPPPLEESKPEEKPKLQICPTCNKEFKHLSRHKCKGFEKIDPKTPNPKYDDPASGKGKIIITSSEKEEHPTSTTMDHSQPPTGTGVVKFGEETVQYNQEEEGLSLYIDAIPLNEDYIYLVDFLLPITDAIEKEQKVEHWRLLEYGKDCDMLAHKLELYIEYKRPAGIVYLDSSTKEGRACKEVLRKHAVKVVQGVK